MLVFHCFKKIFSLQFQKNHPDVYCKRFPTSESEAGVVPEQTKDQTSAAQQTSAKA